jgi:four helix bundle protein
MKENKSYTDLNVWTCGRELVKHLYLLTKDFPKEEVYSLTSQMRRAAISIPSNVAEGVARNHDKETIQFLHIAKGSVYELETQLYLAFDIGYIQETEFSNILLKVDECKKLISGFINYYRNKPS